MTYWTLIVYLLSWLHENVRFMVHGTIDLNLSELQYLAAHLEPRECRRLITALHFHSYELPKNFEEAVNQVDEDIPCLQHLLHWNNAEGEGRGTSHEPLQHRLRQLGRVDLADWLGRTAFEELSNDLLSSIDEPFGAPLDVEITPARTTDLVTSEAPDGDDAGDEYFWLVIELIVMALFALLLFTLVFVVGAAIIDKFARCRCENKKISIDATDWEKRKFFSDMNSTYFVTESDEES